MSSEKFEDLEDELKTLQEDISGKITNKIPRLTGGKSEQGSTCFRSLCLFQKPLS